MIVVSRSGSAIALRTPRRRRTRDSFARTDVGFDTKLYIIIPRIIASIIAIFSLIVFSISSRSRADT
jgi:ABC-type transporter Mla maintaining outer membrane lipid asymmetry permease subunit MlaE